MAGMEPLKERIPATFDPLSPGAPAGQKGGAETASAEREKKLRKACADFEAMLVFQLLKTMRQAVPRSGFLGASPGRATYEMMLDQKIADDLAHKGNGIGLQRLLYDQLAGPAEKKVLKSDGQDVDTVNETGTGSGSSG